jgi:hypothetical protein
MNRAKHVFRLMCRRPAVGFVESGSATAVRTDGWAKILNKVPRHPLRPGQGTGAYVVVTAVHWATVIPGTTRSCI